MLYRILNFLCFWNTKQIAENLNSIAELGEDIKPIKRCRHCNFYEDVDRRLKRLEEKD